MSDTAALRIEQDPLGKVSVPHEALYGPQTMRAIHNFTLSTNTIADMPHLIVALAQVKKAAAIANRTLEILLPAVAEAIITACDEIIAGKWHEQFAVDVLQGGAGTSTNMNANEVIANRALTILGHDIGDYDVISPNDHVNRCQSTNDSYATAVRLSVFVASAELRVDLEELAAAFEKKAVEFKDIPKLGRTQLQDAVPMTLGQEFAAFAITIREDIDRLILSAAGLLEVNLGGTAIGTGAGALYGFRAEALKALALVTDLDVRGAKDLIEASWDMGAFVLHSGMLKRIAAKLSKIANDLRLLSSGPCGGLGEIRLPAMQPGSSLMPGKVNPVIPEAVSMAAYRVFGLDASITHAADAGQLQLNAFEPLIAWSLHESVTLLRAAATMLARKCIAGIEANEIRCQTNLSASMACATYLVPIIGYHRAAEIAAIATIEGNLISVTERLAPEALPMLQSVLNPAALFAAQKPWPNKG